MRGHVLCGQMNLQKGNSGAVSLVQHLRDLLRTGQTKSFLIGVQEPPAGKGKVRILTDGQLFYNHQCERPRTAIYASRDLNLWPMERFISMDLTAVLWRTGRADLPEVVVASAYFDIELASTVPRELERLLRYCSRQGKRVLILADTNAHSSMWGCDNTNRRGEDLEDFILGNDLAICNVGNHRTFFNRRSATIVDVTMASPELTDAIEDWRVVTEVTGSDHHFISFTLTISTTYKRVRNYNKGDWNIFTRAMEWRAYYPTRWDPDILEREADSLVEDLHDALNESHPKVVVSNRIRPFSWWNDDLEKLKKDVKLKASHHRLERTEESHDRLTLARRAFSNAVKRLKRKEWKKFCNDAEDMSKVSLLNKIIRSKERKHLGLLQAPNGDLLSPDESLNYLVDTHFPGSIGLDDTRGGAPHMAGDDSCITVEKVSEAIATFGDLKAPGPDGIHPIVLKRLGKKALRRLTETLKASYRLGYTPRAWRHSRVVFIPKEGKDDYSQPRSFRPITLSSFIMKTLERVILWHMLETTLALRPMCDEQHAFRKQRGTDTALSCMAERIEHALVNKRFALGVFLDIQGAFDNVTPSSIVRGLRQKRADPTTVRWYEQYLMNRSMETEVKGITVQRRLTRGTPQGGVLSPIMWNLVFDSLLACYGEASPVKCVGYADDAGLIIEGESQHALVHHMNDAIERALIWGDRNGLAFSPAKTVSVLFTRKHKFTMPREVKMRGETIEYSNAVRYLGVNFDSKLLFTQHLTTKIKRAKAHLLQIKGAMGKLWGMPPRFMRWAYTGIVRPALTYGCIVWAKAASRTGMRQRLTRLNRLALMSLGHLRRSTPTAGLEVVVNLMPLDLHILRTAVEAEWRTRDFRRISPGDLFTRTPGLKGHRQYLCEKAEALVGNLPQCDVTSVPPQWKRRYKFDMESLSKGEPIKAEITVFTDGSLMQGLAGSGACFYRDGVLEDEVAAHLGDHVTVFQAELVALKLACNWLKEQGYAYKKIVIHSDSQAALKALLSPWVKSNLVRQTAAMLNEVAEENRVYLRWVKAHVGHEGNELADEMAKAGVLDPELDYDDRPLLAVSAAKRMIFLGFLNAWVDRWHAREDCRQTKQWFPDLDLARSDQVIKLNRKLFSNVVQLITGHNFLKRHEALMDPSKDPECRLCMEDEETSFHVVAECPALAAVRYRTFGAIHLDAPLDMSVSGVCLFLRETFIGKLLDPPAEDQ
jgi:ribonuclease HI